MSSAHQAVMSAIGTGRTYATWDPGFLGAGMALSGGDLVATSSTPSTITARSNMAKSSGKWYWEITVTNDPDTLFAGAIGNSSVLSTSYVGSNTYSKGYKDDGNSIYNNSSSAFGVSYTTGDIIGCALDASTGGLTLYKNNVYQGTLTNAVSGPYYAMVTLNANGAILTANFGASAMAYTAPGGYNQGLYLL